MELLNTCTLEVKKSKFIALFYKLDNITEIKEILTYLKKEHKKAKHIVYAYHFNNTAGKCDDKEPSGTAGLQLYNIIENNKLTNNMIVVIRYYGGIKLGIGPLSRTYKNIGLEVIK